MFDPEDQPYREEIGEGLVLRALETEDDIRRLGLFNQKIHHDEEGIREFTVRLIRDHPYTRAGYWLVVEDSSAGEIVSAIALIPWEFCFGGVRLRSAEMGIVGTEERYRGKGLIRKLTARFTELMREDSFVMSHIQGIPYFYRQFGYEYALPLEEHVELELRSIAVAGDGGRIRRAGMDDIPALQRFHDRSAGQWDLHTLRSSRIWSYLLGPSLRTCVAADTYMVESPSGDSVGYFRIGRQGFGKGLILQECSDLPRHAFPSVFSFLKDEAMTRGKPYLRLNLPPFSGAVQYATDTGGRRTGGYRWQIRIPDIAGFLKEIAPALTTRLAQSEYAGYTGTLTLGMYRSAVRIDIEAGAVASIRDEAAAAKADIRFPPNLAPPLLLGDRTLEECRSFYPDVGFDAPAGRLFTALFSRRHNFFYQNY